MQSSYSKSCSGVGSLTTAEWPSEKAHT